VVSREWVCDFQTLIKFIAHKKINDAGGIGEEAKKFFKN
jgi:hypothetical protein